MQRCTMRYSITSASRIVMLAARLTPSIVILTEVGDWRSSVLSVAAAHSASSVSASSAATIPSAVSAPKHRAMASACAASSG